MSNEVLSVLTICVPIITALLSGLLSYILAVKNSNKELDKLHEQHKNEIESMKENHKQEMEKLKEQQLHEKEMKNQEFAGQIGTNLITKIFESQNFQTKFEEMINESFNNKEKK